jgi:hypothetical protein
MFHPDTDVCRQLAREHQAELKRDWQWVNPSRPDVVESRRRHRPFRFEWLRTQLPLIGHAPSGHTP